MIDLVILSDTHELNREVDVPTGDNLIFTGDLMRFTSLSMIEDFNDRLRDLPHPVELVVPGNNDGSLENAEERPGRVRKEPGLPILGTYG